MEQIRELMASRRQGQQIALSLFEDRQRQHGRPGLDLREPPELDDRREQRDHEDGDDEVSVATPKQATGKPLAAAPLLRYLETRYLEGAR